VKKYSENPPDGAGWVVELRGHTYHQKGREFLIDTLVFNLNRIGLLGKDLDGKPLPSDPIRGKVSHAFLYFSREVKDPESGTFKYINNTNLPEILGGGTGGEGGLPGVAGGRGTGMPGLPSSSSSPGQSQGESSSSTASPRSSWTPLGNVPGFTGAGSGVAGGGLQGAAAPGSIRPGASAPVTPLNPMGDGVPGADKEPKNTSGRQRIRYEFVVLFVWKEPITSDNLNAK
jgi:hypothetical protein